MIALVLLGFALGLDSFRVSISLGLLAPSPARQYWTALAFGLCDGLALLVGSTLGNTAIQVTGSWVAYLEPIALGGYGLYTIALTLRFQAPAHSDDRWMVVGLPLTLSLDNFAAGAGLGVLGTPPFLAAVLIGAISGLMSLAALRLGHTIGRFVPARAELIGGVALLLLAMLVGAETR